MDTVLPDICVFTVLKELRQRGNSPKIIILSSVVSQQAAERALTLGAAHFVPKPFHTGALFDLMHGLFHGAPQHPPLILTFAEQDTVKRCPVLRIEKIFCPAEQAFRTFQNSENY